jgi:hypothetical protein
MSDAVEYATGELVTDCPRQIGRNSFNWETSDSGQHSEPSLIFVGKVHAVDLIDLPSLHERFDRPYQRSPIHSHLIAYVHQPEAVWIFPQHLEDPLFLIQSLCEWRGATLFARRGYGCFPFFFFGLSWGSADSIVG